MTPERWEQIKTLFEAAMERDQTQREVFLTEACAGDPPLRVEVDALIAAHEQAESFMEVPAFEPAVESLKASRSAFLVGRRIGPYRILHEIGQGGWGWSTWRYARTTNTVSKWLLNSSSPD